jgi:hypothetical protein
MRGKSWVPLLNSTSPHVYDAAFDFTGWELFDNRAVRKGKYKAILQPPPRGTGEWELYNLDDDPGEIKDLAHIQEFKEKKDELIQHYEVYYQETGMFDASLAFENARKTAASVGKVNEVVGMHGFRGRGTKVGEKASEPWG